MRATDPVQIADLADHPGFLEELARYHHAQWAALNPGRSLQQRIDFYRTCLGPAPIPSMHVAIGNGLLLGSASLVAHDMDTRTDLTPWLASVYVLPAWRCRGVAGALISQVARQARCLGVPRLYLYTPEQQAFYAKRGWRALENCVYHDCEVTIMVRELAADG